MEKKNKTPIIIIILLVFIILCLVGYICYDKGVFGNKESSENHTEKADKIDNNKSEETSPEEIALDDSRFIDIYNKLKPYTYRESRSDGYQSFTDHELLQIIEKELKESDFVETTETTELGGYHYTLYTLENSVVINYLKKYFGNDVVVNGEELIEPSFAYSTNLDFHGNGMSIIDYADGKYKVMFSGGGGGVGGPLPKITERKIISATIENNEIVVKEKAIYWGIPSEQEMITFDVYSDVNKKNKIDSKEYTEDNIANEIVTVEDYLDKASTITTKFAYDQDTNSYYFKSSVIE